jgi:thiamine biosynthesis lipoprotein
MSPSRTTRRELFAALLPAEVAGEHWLRVGRPAMACRFEVVLDSADARNVPAARDALDQVDAIEAALTYFREASELQRLNRAAHEGAAAVSDELFALLALCREIHAASGGAFDPTATPLSRTWGFLFREGRVPAPVEIDAARAKVGFDAVLLDERACTVRFTRPGLELNLGSIGKGWALDRIAASLRAAGVGRALLSAGGSSQRVWGPRPWEVALTSAGETLATLRLRDAAIGTSGAAEQHVEVEGRRYGHVIDPRTGWPAEGVRTATAIADEAAVADALATAFYVGGAAVAAAVCAARPGTMAVLAVEREPTALCVIGDRDGVGIEPAANLALSERS